MRLKKMYSKITNVANKHSFQRATPGVFGVIGSHCDCNLAAVPEKMFRDQFHILYMVRLEVVCVLFNRVSAWTDSVLLDFQQHSVETNKRGKKLVYFNLMYFL